MASLLRSLTFITEIIQSRGTLVLKRILYTSRIMECREFLQQTVNAERIKAEVNANPFPILYLSFTACRKLYETQRNVYGMNKPDGIKFNAAYIDTNPDADNSIPIVVCLHGSPGGHWDFNHLTIFLANKGIRVVVINFPGYCWTRMDEKSQFRNNPEEKAHFVKDFLSCLGIERVKMGVVHSSGVYPGFLLACENLNVFESLVLINPGGLGYFRGLWPYRVLRFYARFYRNVFLRPFLLFFLKLYLIITIKNNTNAAQMAVAIETVANVPHEKFKIYPKFLAARQYRSLLIYSLNDKLVEGKFSNEIGVLLAGTDEHLKFMYDENGQLISSPETDDVKIRHTEQHIFSSGGHYVMKKYPEIVNEIIDRFLQSVLGSLKPELNN